MDRNCAMQIVVVVVDTSLSARRAWIEMTRTAFWFSVVLSLSARRAWIEIFYSLKRRLHEPVALRKESVDRNLTWHCMSEDVSVALRKESVDRNPVSALSATPTKVALRKESVDRNPYLLWQFGRARVALRKESVDRNRNSPICALNR